MMHRIPDLISRSGVEFVVSVPCREFAWLLENIELSEKLNLIFPQREDEGIALMLGLEMSGRKTLGLFQDTLLGNSQNILSVIATSTDISMRFWLGSRNGEYLQQNLVHKYITDRIEPSLSDKSFLISNFEHSKGKEQFEDHELEKINKSLYPSPGIRNFLIWRIT